MTNDILEVCRAVLEKMYDEKLGITFGSSIAEVGKGRQPVWRVVSEEDLTSVLHENPVGSAGLLLDPEIGVLCYILPFRPEIILRKQIVRCLTLRSQLSTERNYTGSINEKSDPRGSWRIVMHWLVERKEKARWIEQVTEIRRETAFSEELSFDAIFLSGSNIKMEIEEYAFPRLLLTTREVFRKNRFEDMIRWLSANELVRNALTEFSAQFHNPKQNEVANEIVQAMKEMAQSPDNATEGIQVPADPRTIRKIRVRNFRNLSDIEFDFGAQKVSTSIIHGPNGTGKSSLCEAVSIALFGSSFRYNSFSNTQTEKDIAGRDRAREYFDKYLTPVNDNHGEPQIALDESSLARPVLASEDKIDKSGFSMTGTILTQDTSLQFARMSSYELGANVLRGYSDLADRIQDFTDRRANQADSERQNFLRGLGLTTAIKKIDTAYERIARREIDKLLPPLPQAFINWLEMAGKVLESGDNNLPQRWRNWGEDKSREELAREVASLNNNRPKLIQTVSLWLQQFNDLILSSSELAKNAGARVEPIRRDLTNAEDRIRIWGEWLEKHEQEGKESAYPETEVLAKQLADLQAQQRDVVERGKHVGDHYDHLTTVEAYVRENWSKQNADVCPTCGTNHSEHGGILKVVESLRSRTAAERDELRLQYNKLKTLIEDKQRKLAELGQTECPLTVEERSSLSQALQWLIPKSADFSQWIEVKSQRESLLSSITTLRQMPSVPALTNVESEAERTAQQIHSQFREADRTFEAPANWKPVKEKLTETLSEIVNKHLPNTLARLWCELALNLTSAAWLLPERPHLEASTKRGEQKVTVQVNDRLVRYILNQSEMHTLGIAWFFTRYLAHNRFFNACIVMDDAAQELDQTSFRDLCRLWETMVRLHRVYDKPLKLIIMLNQENRAIEAARATDGILSILGWSQDQKKINAIDVVGDGFYPPQPESLFENAIP